MDKQRQSDQVEPIYNSSVPMQDIALKTYRERWTKETRGESWSGRSVLAARHDDDEEEMNKKIVGVKSITSVSYEAP